MVESKAKLRHIRISPKKMRLVADAIRGLEVELALSKLPVIFKKSSPIIEKLLKSAVANARDKYDVTAADLKIKSISVDKGVDLKRFSPAAFGRAHTFYKHASHVEIVLVTKEGVKVQAKEKSNDKIETIDLTKTKEDKKTDSKKENTANKDKKADKTKEKKTSAPTTKAVNKDKK